MKKEKKSAEKSADPVNNTNAFYVVVNNSYNEDVECHRKCRRNVIENVTEILRKNQVAKIRIF